MSEKNEITDEEMEGATGGAGYSISSEKTANRGNIQGGTQGGSDTGGGTDPVYGELGDKNLKAVSGGGTREAASSSDFYRDNEEEPKTGNNPTHEHGSMGGQVK